MEQAQRALLRALVQVIWADGEMSDAEREMLGAVLATLGSSQEEVEEVGRMLKEPPRMGDLLAEVPDPQTREEILKLLIAMALADGRIDSAELSLLDRVASQLELTREDLERLRAETVALAQGSGQGPGASLPGGETPA